MVVTEKDLNNIHIYEGKPSPNEIPHSARRVFREEPSESKRQRSEKDPKAKEPKSCSYSVVVEIKTGLRKIEAKLDKSTRDIKDGLSRDHELEERERDPPAPTPDVSGIFDDLKRIDTKMTKHSEAVEKLLRVLNHNGDETKRVERILREVQMERDILQEKMHGYLEQNSSLKSKIEEQRCSIGAYERQVNAEYEIRLRKLESMNEDLRNVAMQKDKHLKEAHEQLKQMSKTLKSHETLTWKKKNEETVFISILKNDLQTIWNDKIRIEEEFKKLKRMCGYTEQDVQQRTATDDYLGNILRRSKSTSDLTLYVKAKSINSIESTEKALGRRNTPSTTPNTPPRHPSKNSHGEGSNSETTSLRSASKQKMAQ